ncbi:hypothetical protein [Arenibaculum sp.]|jgi:ABC-type branched-subunit amino acid transport system permease subunit|uniref:hypothetical protein n=1 Tax=Arenibaculum sp. TaxID=2865862 RepID=UPI002E0DF40B|nr:hypothetical protein [Arenibaculum sp.]
MSLFQAIALAVAAYLLLLARSAWRQGELPQFLWSLALVTALLGAVAAVVAAAIAIDRM